MVVVVFGCDRCLKGVVGHGWVRCLGHWSWLGCGFGVWVVGDGVGQWWLWIVDRRGWVVVVVVDRRAGMNGSLVVDRRLKWVVGRGWIVAEVAPMMTFFEWVCSCGFQIGWVSNRGWVVVVVGLWLRWLR